MCSALCLCHILTSVDTLLDCIEWRDSKGQQASDSHTEIDSQCSAVQEAPGVSNTCRLCVLHSSCLVIGAQSVAFPGPLVNQKLMDGALWLMQHSMVGWLWPARAYTVLDVFLVLFCTVWVPFMKNDNIRWLSDTCQIRVNPCHMSKYLRWWGWLTLAVKWHFLMGLTGALTP